MKFREIPFERWSSLLLTVALGGLFLYLSLAYLLPVALPFLLSWGLALLLRPLNCAVSKRLRLPQRLVAFFTVLLALSLGFLLLYGVLSRLAEEIRSAIAYLNSSPGRLSDFLSWLLPGEGGLLAGLDSFSEDLTSHMADALMAALPPLLGSAVLSLPEVLLFILVSVVAAFYFSLELGRVHKTLLSILPSSLRGPIRRMRADAFRMGLSYLRSYCILTSVIFLIMLLGLCLLGVEYALLLSVVLAAVDILPVVGVGTVLVPWGVVSLALGDSGLGIGLLVLFAVSEVARQVLEPRLVGAALGIHPLLSLFSLYAGARFFGLFGLLLGPLMAVVLKIVFTPSSTEKTKNPSNDGVSVGQARSTLPERRQREHT